MDRINHPTAVDLGGGRRGFRSKDTASGVSGTVVTGAHLNASQEELMSIIERAGLAPAAGDLAQVFKAIRSAAGNYRVATGTPNGLSVVLDPVPTAHADVRILVVLPIHTNTGPAFLNAGAGTLPIKTALGNDTAAGDIVSGVPFIAVCNGAAWVIGLALSDIVRLFVPLTRNLVRGWGVQPIGNLSVDRTIALDQADLDARYAPNGVLIAGCVFDQSISVSGGNQYAIASTQFGGYWTYTTRVFTFSSPLNNANYFIDMMVGSRRRLVNVQASGGEPYVDLNESLAAADITSRLNTGFTVAATSALPPTSGTSRTLTQYNYIRVYKYS